MSESSTGSGCVHGVAVHFYHVGDVVPELESLLLPDEHAEAGRVSDPLERALFVLGRARLRQLLATQLRVHPRALRFTRTEWGKLTLQGARDGPGFNVAHAGDYVLIGVTASRDVGVDVELVRPVDELGLARLCFAPEEADMLRALGAAERRDAFFRLWTLREALLKALGRGFTWEDAREVALGGDADAPRIVRSRAAGVIPGDWVLSALQAPPHYVAALVLRSGADACKARDERTP